MSIPSSPHLEIQKSCQDILDNEGQISFGGIYTIDPDFNGPANPFEVSIGFLLKQNAFFPFKKVD